MQKYQLTPNYENISQSRFGLYVYKTNTCWIWTGSLTKTGYGQFHYQRKTWKAHRLSYFWKSGNLIQDKDLHHKCNNKLCVNPDHLEILSKFQHSKHHGQTRFKPDKCPQGHEFNEQNTRYNKFGWRLCKRCSYERKKEWREKCRKEGKKVT